MVDECLTMVVGNSIVLVPEVDGAAAYDDLINSILLAQLVANKKIEKKPEVIWYDAYMEVLDAYWLRPEKAHQTWGFRHKTEELLPNVFTAMLTHGASGDAHTIAAVLARIAKLSDEEPALQLLRSHMQALVEPAPAKVSAPLTSVRLLVIDAKSPTSITSAYVEFKTRKVLSPNPFQPSYQSDDLHGLVHVHHACETLVEQLYGPVRAAIAVKVRDRLAGNVATLTLPAEVKSCRIP